MKAQSKTIGMAIGVVLIIAIFTGVVLSSRGQAISSEISGNSEGGAALSLANTEDTEIIINELSIISTLLVTVKAEYIYIFSRNCRGQWRTIVSYLGIVRLWCSVFDYFYTYFLITDRVSPYEIMPLHIASIAELEDAIRPGVLLNHVGENT